MGVVPRMRLVGSVAAAMSLLGVTASTASAAVQFVEEIDTFNGRGSLEVSCPNGTNVLAGGMGTFNGYGGILLTGSYPVDDGDRGSVPDDGWKVDVINRGGLEVSVYGLCEKQKLDYMDEKFDFPRYDDGNGIASCPKGTHIISGGGRAGTMLGLLPDDGKDSDKKPDDRYVVHTESGATGKTKGVAWAICGKAKVTYVTTKTPPIAPHDEGGEFDAICPDGSEVMGGGAGIDVGHRDGAINSLFPRADSVQAWGTYLDNYDGSESNRGRVVAVCSA